MSEPKWGPEFIEACFGNGAASPASGSAQEGLSNADLYGGVRKPFDAIGAQEGQGGLTEESILETILLFRRAGENTPFADETAQRCARAIFGKVQSAILARQSAPVQGSALQADKFSEHSARRGVIIFVLNAYRMASNVEIIADAILAALGAPQAQAERAAVPEGWREPSTPMIEAALASARAASFHIDRETMREMLRVAMLAAAPVAQEGKAVDGGERRKCRQCDATTNADNPVELCPGCEAPAAQQDSAECWSCKRPYTAEQRADADGNCPHCGVEIELDEQDSTQVDTKGGEA